MKKDFLFILLIIGVIFSISVFAWPNSYQSQVINYQGYYKTNQANATWQPVTISPLYGWQPLYRNGTWIGGYGTTYVNYILPTNAAIFAAYGCCSNNTNSSWYQTYGCYNVTTQRYREQTVGEWRCGWNIAYSSTNQTNYTCTDTDGGLNYLVYGTAISNYNGNKNDNCLNNSTLREAYCQGYSSQYSNYNCQSYGTSYTCSAGRCQVNQTGNLTG